MSEARILIYLETSDKQLHFVRKISGKLGIDYGYTIKILLSMFDKGWIEREKVISNPSRTYYHLTKKGRLKIIDAHKMAMEVVEEGK